LSNNSKSEFTPQGVRRIEFDEGKIDALFSRYNQCHAPGVAVGISIGGVPVYRKGFGLASMNLPVTLSPSTRMRVGSISKQFTALAFLLLCEQGRAGIDDPLGKHLPELSPITHKVTMRQLMNHTSGLRDAFDLVQQFSGVDGPSVGAEDFLSMYRWVNDVNAPPGTSCLYNNGAYVILSAVIERVTHQRLEDVLQDCVFAPIGMHDTRLRRWDYSFMSNSADPHLLHPQGGWQGTGSLGGRDMAGAAMVSSTIDDMLRWMAHMDAPTVGSRSNWEAMKAAPRLLNGTTGSYGLGLYSLAHRGVETIGHGGMVYGINARMCKVPAASLDIVVIANRSDVSAFQLTEEIIETCMPGLVPANMVKPVMFTSGLFISAQSGRVLRLYPSRLAFQPGDVLQIGEIDGHPLPFAADENGVFRSAPPALISRITLTRQGDPLHPEAVELDDYGHREMFFPAKSKAGGRKQTISGRYRSEALGIELTILAGTDGLLMTAHGQFGIARHRLEHLADGICRTTAVNPFALPTFGVVRLDDNEESLVFSNFLTRNLHFERVA
jgi:D-aminopeptidase